MFLTIVGPVGHREELAIDLPVALGTVFSAERVFINGIEIENWRDFVPSRGDRVEIWQGAGEPISSTLIAIGTAAGLSAATAAAVSNIIISLAISLTLSGIMKALTPKPKKPRAGGKEEAFGIAGFSNTVGPGTRKFVPYGINQIHGHVIGSGATLSADGRQMMGRVLYFMGDTGGDGIDGIQDVQIDGTDIWQFPEIWGDGIGTPTNHMHVRLGLDVQDVIPEFENVDNLFTDGRALPFDTVTMTGTPIVYTTQSANINRATLFLFFPGGLYRTNGAGKHRAAAVTIRIEYKKTSDGSWTVYEEITYNDQIESGVFKTFDVNFPSAENWQVRLTKIAIFIFDENPFVHDTILYNVQETVFTSRTYPGSALLGITNLPASKIRSFQAMECSAVVRGKRVKIPDGLGNTTLAFTRQRCWIVRDMMTHPVVGMGSEIDESEINDEQWLESQAYYDELVVGHNPATGLDDPAYLEVRDLCDFVLNDADWDWEWVKSVAGEARGRIVPSGDRWNYVIDRPGTPNLLYAEGANIIEGSIGIEISHSDRPFNQISAKFRDADKEYDRNFANAITDPDIGSDPIVQEVLQYDTITRESQVDRENMIIFKRAFLERRRWSYHSPMGAIVSEPMDLDYLAERGIGNEGSYTGILGAGSTVSTVILPEPVELEPGPTYALIIGHIADNTTEYRQVSTGPGVTALIAVTSPFIQAPAQSDRFSLGKENIDHIITRAQELEIDREGRVRQVRTEYIPEIYTQDPLPPKTQRRFFNLKDNRPPLPIRYASVTEQVTTNRDGSTRSVLIFSVTPGLAQHAGLAAGGTVNGLVLSTVEPALDDYFINAKVTVNNQQRTINAYTGSTRAAGSPPFDTAPVVNDEYTILWERFSEFGGFNIEHSEDGVNFIKFATVLDTHYESDSQGVGPGVVYFRFTPFSNARVENALARYVLSVNLQGDLSAPLQPLVVELTSYLLTVRVLVYLTKPVAEDFSGVEIDISRNAQADAGGLLLERTRFGAPADSGTGGGTMRIEATFNLGARFPPEAYGAVIYARARSVDFSQNLSFFTNAAASTTLTPDPASVGIGVGPPAVPQGLTLSTGTIVDPFDGVIKPFLFVTWIANTESDIDRYEIHIRLQADSPSGPVTARIVSHPQISIREIGLIGGVVYEVRIQAIDRTNNPSGFTAWLPILIAHDQIPPPAPSIVSGGLLGGFEMISLYFQPPSVPDFAFVEAWIAPSNNRAAVTRIERSAPDSISIRAAGVSTLGADFYTYFVWLRAVDTSGNSSSFDRADNDGWPVTVRKVSAADVAQFSAVITGSAQIGTAIIQDAHIQSLLADRISGGNINAFLRLGVGGQIYIDGLQRIFWVIDDTNQVRVQLGRLGTGIQDYGLQIFGANGSLFHSFTGGTQTAGRQDQNQASFAVSLQAGNITNDFIGCFVVQNTTNTITVRVRVAGRTGSGKGASSISFTQADYTINHGIGKTMAVSPALTSIVETDGDLPATATLLVHYW